MSTLDETSEWVEGIYQLEETDPVLGGTPNESTGAGMDNIPHLHLAKRTVYLKEHVDDLEARSISASGLATGGGNLSENRTITVTAASQAQAQAGTDNATAMTPLRVAQAIAALVGVTVSFGAPGYIKIAGLIIQWGSTAAADANGLAVGTLPTAFTTAVYMAISGENSTSSGASGNVIITGWLPDATTLTQIAFRTAKPTTGAAVSEAVNYIVIGK